LTQNIATAERSGGIIEPLPKLQWFIDVNKKITIPHSTIQGIASGSVTSLKELMKKAVENGHIKIIPERFQRTYDNWIENLHDWCISAGRFGMVTGFRFGTRETKYMLM
jgi:valyl-tRNA synthetase